MHAVITNELCQYPPPPWGSIIFHDSNKSDNTLRPAKITVGCIAFAS